MSSSCKAPQKSSENEPLFWQQIAMDTSSATNLSFQHSGDHSPVRTPHDLRHQLNFLQPYTVTSTRKVGSPTRCIWHPPHHPKNLQLKTFLEGMPNVRLTSSKVSTPFQAISLQCILIPQWSKVSKWIHGKNGPVGQRMNHLVSGGTPCCARNSQLLPESTCYCP